MLKALEHLEGRGRLESGKLWVLHRSRLWRAQRLEHLEQLKLSPIATCNDEVRSVLHERNDRCDVAVSHRFVFVQTDGVESSFIEENIVFQRLPRSLTSVESVEVRHIE